MKCLFNRRSFVYGLLALLAMAVNTAEAGRPRSPLGAAADGATQIGLFEAIQTGQVEAQFIPLSSKGANVIIRNKTKKSLAIQMPATFSAVCVNPTKKVQQKANRTRKPNGAVGFQLPESLLHAPAPVLAQFGGQQGGFGGQQGGFGGGGLGGGGGNQGLGGGFGGGGGGLGGGGLGGGGQQGGFFNIAAEKVGKIPATTVCLEHGKRDPRPHMKYEIRPLESFTQNPKVHELCRMLGNGEVPQNAAQATAWHLMDGLSWAELAQKDRVRLRNGYSEKYFSPQEMHLAVRIANEVEQRAKRSLADEKADSLSQQ